MKKIFYLIILLFIYGRVFAIESIKIDNNSLIPIFDKDTYVYNYYTDKNEVDIKIINSKDDIKSEIIKLNKDETIYKVDNYKIRIFKNYENKKSESYIKELTIKNYDIKFDNNKFNYEITLNDEDHLNIDYELSNSSDKITIMGNGNFNKSDNIIKIIFNDKTYTIHAYKTIKVSKTIKNEEVKEMSNNKKEIVKLIIFTISSLIVFGFYYIIFKDKRTMSI